MSQQTIFVAGATGIVGNGVARNLLLQNISVRALARTPSSPAALALSALGAVLIPGSYDDPAALSEATSGITGVFLNLTPNLANLDDRTQEAETARRILAAARAGGATHAIYSSGFAVQAPERLRHWDPESTTAAVLFSKQAVEREVRAAGFARWTILRPGNFATNYVMPQVAVFPELVREGRFVTALRPETRLATLDPYDIGKFAAAAFCDPERFGGREIPVSAEMLTPDEIMRKLAKVTGREFTAVYLSDDEVEAQKGGNPFVAGQLAMRDADQFADEEDTRSWGIPLATFDEFLEREKEKVKETYGQLV